jgi:hypothetical protein
MDHKERVELSRQLSGKELLQLLKDFINSGHMREIHRAIVDDKALENWHPTLQQALMREFIVPAVQAMSKITHPDDRNKGTVEACIEALPILEKHRYPFI